MATWFEEDGTFDKSLGKYTINKNSFLNRIFASFNYDGYTAKDLKYIDLTNCSNTLIFNGCFQGCTNLSSINLSNKINAIGPKAFKGCTSLEFIDLKSDVNIIGVGAFQGCKNLREFSRIGNLKIIEDQAFDGCDSLKTIDLKDSVEKIGYAAFAGCTSLQEITGTNKLKIIEPQAFRHCINLQGTLDFKQKIQIDDMAFTGCQNLQRIWFKDRVSLRMKVFEGCNSLPPDILKYPSDANLSAFKGSNLERQSQDWVQTTSTKFSDLPAIYKWVKTSEPLFPQGNPKPSDIKQGRIGDCWLLAVLASIAASHPEIIEKCMHDDPENGIVSVSLYTVKDVLHQTKPVITIQPERPVKIIVNRTVPCRTLIPEIIKNKLDRTRFNFDDPFMSKHALWVKIMEKAIADYIITYLGKYALNRDTSLHMEDVLRGSLTVQGFNCLGTNLTNLQDLRQGCTMAAITGAPCKFTFLPMADNIRRTFDKINSKVSKGQAIECSAPYNADDNILSNYPGLVLAKRHAYSIIGTMQWKNSKIENLNILTNADKNAVIDFFNLYKFNLSGKNISFLILRNPHGREGVITIPTANNQWEGKVESCKDGICIVDINFFCRFFNFMILRTTK